MNDSALVERTVPAFALQSVTVRRIIDLSPTFRRVVFTGDDVRHIADNRFDQRIKLMFARPGREAFLPETDDWYAAWRGLDEQARPVIRTYTIREVRAEACEFDVDIALHGRIGPASAWAIDAVVGDEIVVCVPDRRCLTAQGGIDWRAPTHTERLLLVGDETALPAIAGILEMLPATARGIVVVEVPDAADAAILGARPEGIELRVLARASRPIGSLLDAAARAAAEELVSGRSMPPLPVDDVDIERGLLWEVPDPSSDGAALYAWLAGEAGVLKALRRHLVGTLGIDRGAVAFMGYWREGRADAA
ncbi:MAG: hypothetical protein RI885_1218 [Actinomycetota bacterium]|jgi:NADPH-dependent ferric siderophore reductase